MVEYISQKCIFYTFKNSIIFLGSIFLCTIAFYVSDYYEIQTEIKTQSIVPVKREERFIVWYAEW